MQTSRNKMFGGDEEMDMVRATITWDLQRGGIADGTTSHCEFLEVRLLILISATDEDIIHFLKWILIVDSRVRKRSTYAGGMVHIVPEVDMQKSVC